MVISVACSGFPPHAPLHVPSHPDAAKADDEKEMIITAADSQREGRDIGCNSVWLFLKAILAQTFPLLLGNGKRTNLLQSRRVDRGKQKEERHENLRDAPQGKPATSAIIVVNENEVA